MAQLAALTDHATQENHVINWSQATEIDREPERFTRWIKEAIHIRKEGQQAMNSHWGVGIFVNNTLDCSENVSYCINSTDSVRVENIWLNVQKITTNLLLAEYIVILVME